MARRIAEVVAEDGSLRAHLIARCKADLAKLPEASEVYDFSAQRDRLLDRLAALRAGRTVEVHRLEIPAETRPPRGGPLLYRLVGNRLEVAPYERADGTVR